MIRLFTALAICFLSTTSVHAQAGTVKLTVAGGKEDLNNVIVTVPLAGRTVDDASRFATVVSEDGKTYRAQLAAGRLLSGEAGKRGDTAALPPELQVLIPEIKAGQTLNLTAKLGGASPKEGFSWSDVESLPQLSLNDRPVLRLFHRKFDPALYEKGKEIANPSTKPFHHLFASDGKTIVTNSNQGQYPHHRGIYYGFNNISYDGKKADVWHCRAGEHTAFEKVLATEAGPLFGRHTLQIAWKGTDGKVFANERRELAVYNVSGGTLIDFASELTTPLNKVRLDGDPQHAGFHFRANSAMEKNAKETYFIRPDGKGKPGEEKNWLPKGKGGPINLPWNAMSFMLDGKRYTVVYLDHPNNPKEARQSERCYGRIGTYFEYDLSPDKPLKVRYRLWFQDGEPTMEQCQALSKAFIETPIGKLRAQ